MDCGLCPVIFQTGLGIGAILRVRGMAHELRFQNYHRVLSRAGCSSRQASRFLLQQLVKSFAPDGVLVMGMDDTIERRWGKRIAARGIYRDPVRSSDSHFVKPSGLRWLSLMLFVNIPWARQMLTQVRRWIPHRAIVLVADSSFAVLAFLDALRQLPTTIFVITRLRQMPPSMSLLQNVNQNKWVAPAQWVNDYQLSKQDWMRPKQPGRLSPLRAGRGAHV